MQRQKSGSQSFRSQAWGTSAMKGPPLGHLGLQTLGSRERQADWFLPTAHREALGGHSQLL
jgi:hypothetical protein